MAAGDLTPGKRMRSHDWTGAPPEPGIYWQDAPTGKWYGATPRSGYHIAGLEKHQVVEHEDGTITVSPSILVDGEWQWHGYLEHGVWREV